MSIRSQLYEQMNRDVQSGLNSIASSMQGLANAKQAYDYSFEQNIKRKAQELEDIHTDNIRKETDIAKWDLYDQTFFNEMDSYLNSINAPQSVRSWWKNDLASQYKNVFAKNRNTHQEDLFWNSAKLGWDNYVNLIGSDDSYDFESASKALQKYWDGDGSNLRLAPAEYKVTSLENAIENMRLSKAYQAGMKAYQSQIENEAVDYNAIIKSATESIPFKNEYERQQVINKVVSEAKSSEATAQAVATSVTAEISRKYNSAMVAASGFGPNVAPSYTLDDIQKDLEQAGAWNDDGSINRFFEDFVLDTYESWQKQQALAEFNNTQTITTDDIIEASSGTVITENDPYIFDFKREQSGEVENKVTVSYEGLTPAKLINYRRKGLGLKSINEESYPYVGAAILSNGQLNFNNNYGKKTYKMNGESVTVEHSPVVENLCKMKGYTSDEAKFGVAKAVYEAEQNTSIFTRPDQYSAYTTLRAQQINDPGRYAQYVYETLRDGVFTAEELKSLGLWDTEWDNFYEKEPYKSWIKGPGTDGDIISTRVKAHVLEVSSSDKNYLKGIDSKVSEVSGEKLDIITDLYSRIKPQMMSWLASNPKATNKEFKEQLDKLIQMESPSAIFDSVNKILSDHGKYFSIDTDSQTFRQAVKFNIKNPMTYINGPVDALFGLWDVAGLAVSAGVGLIGGEEAGASVRNWFNSAGSFKFPVTVPTEKLTVDNRDAQTFMADYFHNGTNAEYIIPDFVEAWDVVNQGKSSDTKLKDIYDRMLNYVSTEKYDLSEAWTFDNVDDSVKGPLACSMLYAQYRETFKNQVVDVFGLASEGFQIAVVDGVGFACIASDGRCYMLDDDPSTARSWTIGRVSDSIVQQVFNSKGTTKIKAGNITGAYNFKLGLTDGYNFSYTKGKTPANSTQRKLARIYQNLGY